MKNRNLKNSILSHFAAAVAVIGLVDGGFAEAVDGVFDNLPESSSILVEESIEDIEVKNGFGPLLSVDNISEISTDAVQLPDYSRWVEPVEEELRTLTEDQWNEISDIWLNNYLVFNNPEDMLSVYDLEYLSPAAQYVFILLNINAHAQYIIDHFEGSDLSHWEVYRSAYYDVGKKLGGLATIDLSSEDVQEDLIAIVAESYAQMRLAMETEEEDTGEAALFAVANTYWDEQAAEDVQVLFNRYNSSDSADQYESENNDDSNELLVPDETVLPPDLDDPERLSDSENIEESESSEVVDVETEGTEEANEEHEAE